ncbi:huntingtin-interacting protein 1 isoform X2 [Planococcus citri]|uniref:huntingtin-interacting protein 1 isoform X2 n=1 Tax=Planococcus citri TaxID=170843 RepID=UPI0031F7ED68
MSSLSLPRVLPQRKTSLELERENFEKFQAASISKAINNAESPVKEKHVRIAIMGTFRDKSPELFWQCVMKLPLQENRIAAWKFCHVLHKVLRDGHPNTIPYSHRHKNKIVDLGKLWCHLKEGYGKLIHQYCQLLLVKLDFHQKNPGFPGNLLVSSEDLEKISENDINNYFQMAVEMFDYMDEILSLQESIFGSLDMSRSNSMTSSGQCRLAPLIQCIQDSSQLYDYCVKILFKLHAQLPPDVLSGHRTRFLKQFQRLRHFYLSSSNLQYFKNLIQIPLLPENPPNILVQAELRTYVTPVVILPQEEPDASQIANDLVDVSSESSQNCSRSMSPDVIAQRDQLIEHLQGELSSTQTMILQLKRRIISLEEQLSEKEEQMSKLHAEIVSLTSQLEEISKAADSEEKAKILEEKFNKLKEVYSKLREEHIQLIRQKADVDKQLANVKNIDVEIAERTKLEEELATLQATADAATEQNEELMCKMEWTVKEKSLLESKLQESTNVKNELNNKLIQAEFHNSNQRNQTYERCKEILDQVIFAMSDHTFNSVTCSPDDLDTSKEKFIVLLDRKEKDPIVILHNTVTFMLLGKATSNTIPDLEKGEKMIANLKKIGLECRTMIDFLQKNESNSVNYDDSQLRDIVFDLSKLYGSAMNGNSIEALSDSVENELTIMDKAIEEAANRIEEMLKESKVADSGIKLEVNGKILDSCTTLMKAIRILVQKSRILQAEIVAAGNPNNRLSAKEFYKRNHQWTEGLISAAKAVGMGAKYLLTAADDVVSGNGKLERLIVAAQGVAASTAHLVVASRVKADRNSSNLIALSTASKDVTNATGNVVATVKSCGQLVEESEDLDFSGLSLHQAKRLEMDSQVRVLELEAGLEKERLKLAALRRYHYQLSGDLEQS